MYVNDTTPASVESACMFKEMMVVVGRVYTRDRLR